jgi:arylsulfatase A-like enzyme
MRIIMTARTPQSGSYQQNTPRRLLKNGLAEHTLVIFTSDNGCSPAASVRELESKGHYLSYVFHGYCQPWMES